jgi:Ca2+-binding RTX toxin-like protein
MPLKTTLLPTAIACAAVAALLPGVAAAATVTRDGSGALIYTAAGGATNNVDVQQNDPQTSDITFYTGGGDTITSIAAGCAQSTLYPGEVVTCTAGTGVRVELGDGDDRGVISGAVSVPVAIAGGPGSDLLEDGPRANTLDGGPGDDKLNGGAGDDVLLGGDGNDDLQGKAGRDRLDGGAGDDVLHPDGYEGASADLVDGGPGLDTVDQDYSSRFTDVDPLVAITLAGGADDGRPGEGDELVNVEKVSLNVGGRFVGTDGPDEFRLAQVGDASELVGGGGDDRLRAGDGPDRVDGGPGNDVLDAGFGDDVIVGGPGRDTISGDLAGGDCGPLWCKYPYGNDTIEAVDGEVDSITCGAGQDTVRADAADVVAPDCETVTRDAGGAAAAGPKPPTGPAGPARPGATAAKLVLAAHPPLATALRRGLSVRVTGAPAGRLALTARLRATGVVARGTQRVGADGRATVRLRFTAKARRTLGRARRATLAISGAGASLTVALRRR